MISIDLQLSFNAHRLKTELVIQKGQIIGLAGPSGIGKTTIIKSIAGLTTAQEGTITLDEEIWLNKNNCLPAQQRRCGIVFQDYALFPNMTAAENVTFSQRISATELQQMYDLFEITSFLSKRPQELSGGQQQRVAIVRALASDPILLLLDEAFSALDESIKSKIIPFIKSHIETKNKYCLASSHNRSELQAMSHETIHISAEED